MTSRSYCATFFTKPANPLPDGVRYAIYGEEICPETKRVHWQAYIELKDARRITGVKTLFNDQKVHLEKRRGTRLEAKDYCMKDNKYEEFGKWIKGRGHRSDLDDVIERIREGDSLSTIMVEEPETYCKYRNGIRDIYAAVNEENCPKWRDVEVILCTGPTGCGKTRLAMEEASYKIQGHQLQWWQDYDKDAIICIDEYNNNLPIDELLALLDGYKLRLNVKGSHTYARWSKVYITTNLTVDELHAQAKPAHRDALFRRITRIKSWWNEDQE